MNEGKYSIELLRDVGEGTGIQIVLAREDNLQVARTLYSVIADKYLPTGSSCSAIERGYWQGVIRRLSGLCRDRRTRGIAANVASCGNFEKVADALAAAPQ